MPRKSKTQQKQVGRTGPRKAAVPKNSRMTMSANVGVAQTYAAGRASMFDMDFKKITDEIGGSGVQVTYRGLIGTVTSLGTTNPEVLVKQSDAGEVFGLYFNPGASSEFSSVLTSIAKQFRRFRLSGPELELQYTPIHGVSDSATVEHGGVMCAYVSDPSWIQQYTATTTAATAWAALASTNGLVEFPTSLPAKIRLPVPNKGPLLYRSIYNDSADLTDERFSYAGGLVFAWAGGSPPATTVEYGDLMLTVKFDLFEIGLPSGDASLLALAKRRAASQARLRKLQLPALGSSAFPVPWPVQITDQPIQVVDVTPPRDEEYVELKGGIPPPNTPTGSVTGPVQQRPAGPPITTPALRRQPPALQPQIAAAAPVDRPR